jgi:hypothetical protein
LNEEKQPRFKVLQASFGDPVLSTMHATYERIQSAKEADIKVPADVWKYQIF